MLPATRRGRPILALWARIRIDGAFLSSTQKRNVKAPGLAPVGVSNTKS